MLLIGIIGFKTTNQVRGGLRVLAFKVYRESGWAILQCIMPQSLNDCSLRPYALDDPVWAGQAFTVKASESDRSPVARLKCCVGARSIARLKKKGKQIFLFFFYFFFILNF